MASENRKRKKKILNITIPIILILVVGIFVLPSFFNKSEEVKKYSVFNLTKNDLSEKVSASGKIESKESSNISASTEGRIKKVYVVLGQQVKKGQLLAEMEDSNIQNEIRKTLAASSIDLQNAAMNKNNKARDLESAKYLYSLGEISQEELRKAQSDYDAAAMEYSQKSAGSDVSYLRKQLNDTKLVSPIDGTVTFMNAKAGTQSSGVMFVVEKTKDLALNASVSEYDINKIVSGQKAVVKSEMTGEEEFAGTVSLIAPAATKQQVTGQQDASSANDKTQFKVMVAIQGKHDNLKIGSNARVNIITSERGAVLAVPSESLAMDKKGYAVFEAIKKGDTYKAKKIRVTTGMETDLMTEISGSGLREGMKLVLSPQGLRSGQKFKVTKAPRMMTAQ